MLSIAWQFKWTLALCLAVGAALGAAVGLVLPRAYQSTAQIAVVKKRSDAIAGVDTRQLSAEDSIAPPQDLLKSSIIIENALRSSPYPARPARAVSDVDPTEQVRNALTVVPGRAATGQGNVYRLFYRSGSEDESRAVLAAVVDSYRQFLATKHQSDSRDTIELILREKDKLRQEVGEQESAYKAFRDQAPLLSRSKDGVEIRQERLNAIQARRSALLLSRVEIEGQLAAVETAIKESRSRDAIITMLVEFNRKGDGTEPEHDKGSTVQEQLVPLLLEEGKLAKLRGPRDPELLAVRERIQIARRLMVLPPAAWVSDAASGNSEFAPRSGDPIDLHVQMLKQKLDRIQSSEELLTVVYKTEEEQARRLTSYEIQDEAFRTKIALNQQLYEALTKRLSDVSLIRDAGGYEVEVIEEPSSGRRVGPELTLMAFVGAFLGVLGGVLLVQGRARSHRPIRNHPLPGTTMPAPARSAATV